MSIVLSGGRRVITIYPRRPEFDLVHVFGRPSNADLVHDLHETGIAYPGIEDVKLATLVAGLREILATNTKRTVGDALRIMLDNPNHQAEKLARNLAWQERQYNTTVAA